MPSFDMYSQRLRRCQSERARESNGNVARSLVAMKLAKALACVIFGAVSLAGMRHATRTIAIHADALLDTRQGRTVRDALVVVSNGRIAYAGSTSDFRAPVPAGAERIELRKVTLLPGLVDAHVHLTLGGSPASNARATVEAGFTTVRIWAQRTRRYSRCATTSMRGAPWDQECSRPDAG
jgi:hypothetical protein